MLSLPGAATSPAPSSPAAPAPADDVEAKAVELAGIEWDELLDLLLESIGLFIKGPMRGPFALPEPRGRLVRIWAPFLNREFPLRKNMELVMRVLLTAAVFKPYFHEAIRRNRQAARSAGVRPDAEREELLGEEGGDEIDALTDDQVVALAARLGLGSDAGVGGTEGQGQ